MKVSATNLYGESPQSQVGDGASIWVIPDAPVNFENNAAVTDASKIGLNWLAGINNGGTAVLDYRLYYALEADAYTLLESNILTTSYTTSVALTTGVNYKFKL